ncbi:transposase [Lutimonas sp.]|uniref:transposase n=1 Tax=Lutimonas sp. TaxID=1872403 RepID=UPI003D9B4706
MKSYKNINDPQRSFVAPFVDKHSKKNEFFSQINELINWKPITTKLKKIYTKGLTERGAKAYSPVLLFKMHLISEWYQISDTQTEAMVYDSISALRFCGLSLEENVPGHSTLSRFKKELIDHNALTDLTKEINLQLAEHDLAIHPGKSRINAKLISKNHK